MVGRIVKLAILVYIIGGLGSIALNGFDFNRDVERRPPGWCELREEETRESRGDQPFICAETADLVRTISFNWISWSFFSDGKGYDQVYYEPVDIIFLLGVLGMWKIYSTYKGKGLNDTKD